MFSQEQYQTQLMDSLNNNKSTFNNVLTDLQGRRAELEERKANRHPLEGIDLSGISRALANASGTQAAITRPPEREDYDGKLAAMDKNIMSAQFAQNGNDLRLANAMKPKQDPMALLNRRLDRTEIENRKKRLHAEKLAKIKADAKAKADAAKTSKGKSLTDSGATEMSDLRNQYSAMDDIMADWNKNVGNETSGEWMFSGLAGSLSPWDSDVENYDDQKRVYAQAVGKALEGGKLTDEDYVNKYMKYFPANTDSPERAKNKIDILKKLLKDSYDNRVETYKDTNFNTGNLPLGLGDDPDKLLKELGL